MFGGMRDITVGEPESLWLVVFMMTDPGDVQLYVSLLCLGSWMLVMKEGSPGVLQFLSAVLSDAGDLR